MSNYIDNHLFDQAKYWAESVVGNFHKYNNNEISKFDSDDENRLWNELTEFGWFDLCPLGKGDEITKCHLAIQKYGKLKWNKENDKKNKLSKWEIVTGKRIHKND